MQFSPWMNFQFWVSIRPLITEEMMLKIPTSWSSVTSSSSTPSFAAVLIARKWAKIWNDAVAVVEQIIAVWSVSARIGSTTKWPVPPLRHLTEWENHGSKIRNRFFSRLECSTAVELCVIHGISSIHWSWLWIQLLWIWNIS